MCTALSGFRKGLTRRLQVVAAVALLSLPLDGAAAQARGAKVTAQPIPDSVWAYMQGRSWRAELPCPGRNQLVLLRVPYLDFDGASQTGSLIVARSVAKAVAGAFQDIYDSGKFRIYRMSLIDEFDGDDARSMAANNTSGFNCRTTDRGAMSRHAYGMAVDINPVQNPYREGNLTEPEAGRAYDRPDKRRRDIVGIIVDGDVVTRAFARQGWRWGGHWKRSVDYQHFSNDGH
ncbi:MAG: M15 family metallopeptidase [Methylocystis sp.]|uniref:M15 family metallopeptidase n=1 Tax=Methylocystis sp. TaxID=1911079 RepID=UPI003D0EC92C